MEVGYTPTFIRMLKACSTALQKEALEKIELFRDPQNHVALKVHKLHGRLKDRYSFSVNYRFRIIFGYTKTNPKEAVLHAIGDHDDYDQC